jgi:lysyl-tRNA synthetase class 2
MPVNDHRRPTVRVERHALGPRLHLLGRRVHEWHAGLLVAVAGGALALLHLAAVIVLGVAAVAGWLIAKDWRDLRPTTRDTAAWRLGVHRLPGAGGPRLRDRVPTLAAAATAVVGLVNVASATTSELPSRLRTLVALAPTADVRLAHALALPAGLALVAAAVPIARRRRRAAHLAIGLLVALGVLNLLKGLDVEEALLSWALAFALWRARAAFWVRHAPDDLRRVAVRATTVVASGVLAALVIVAGAASHAVQPLALTAVPEATLSLLAMAGTPTFGAPLAWLPTALGVLAAGVAATAAAMLLAPLRPVRVADAVDRARAAAVVRRHGTDTLSAFKLRADLNRHWSADGAAMAAYRVEAGTLLLAGDPVGPGEAVPGVLDGVIDHARRHGLAVGAVGASAEFSACARRAGLRRLYLGDEAILDTGVMDLAGGAKKSLRKAVRRIERNGYTAELLRVDELDRGTLAGLHAVSERWRAGTPERGFSMTHDALVDDLLPDALVVLGRDDEGTLRAFLHFVPVFGRDAVSLGFMRRDRDTPNGLNDFLVVEAARLLGERGFAEFSLNFATCGRWLREPANALERGLARGLRFADRWFQVERLLRFNAKFDPRWQPRYLLFEGPAQLPRVALAAMWAEGQLPRPRLLPHRPARNAPLPAPA